MIKFILDQSLSLGPYHANKKQSHATSKNNRADRPQILGGKSTFKCPQFVTRRDKHGIDGRDPRAHVFRRFEQEYGPSNDLAHSVERSHGDQEYHREQKYMGESKTN